MLIKKIDARGSMASKAVSTFQVFYQGSDSGFSQERQSSVFSRELWNLPAKFLLWSESRNLKKFPDFLGELQHLLLEFMQQPWLEAEATRKF